MKLAAKTKETLEKQLKKSEVKINDLMKQINSLEDIYNKGSSYYEKKFEQDKSVYIEKIKKLETKCFQIEENYKSKIEELSKKEKSQDKQTIKELKDQIANLTLELDKAKKQETELKKIIFDSQKNKDTAEQKEF